MRSLTCSDVGDLGPGGGTAGEGALAAVGRGQRRRGRPLLLGQRHRGPVARHRRPDRRRRPDRDFEPVAADDQRVAVAQPPRPVQRLAVEGGAVAAVEVGRHQHLAAPLDLQVVPGDRLVLELDVGLRRAPDDRELAGERHRPRRLATTRNPDPRIHPREYRSMGRYPSDMREIGPSASRIKSAAVSGADTEKRIAAEAAAELVEDGMTVGLGTGSTVAHLLPAIARRGVSGIRCVATSVATEEQARELGIPVEEFDSLQRLDIAIDGTDEVTPDGWLIKGGGGAHLREKIVAAAAERFVVIADSSKPVDALRGPVPLELFAFGIASTLARLGAEVELRDVPPSPDGGTIADYRGAIADPAELAARLEADPGVAAHGLFPPDMVSELFIGRGDIVERPSIRA